LVELIIYMSTQGDINGNISVFSNILNIIRILSISTFYLTIRLFSLVLGLGRKSIPEPYQ